MTDPAQGLKYNIYGSNTFFSPAAPAAPANAQFASLMAQLPPHLRGRSNTRTLARTTPTAPPRNNTRARNNARNNTRARNNASSLKRSFGQRNLFNPTRNNRNAQWSRYGQSTINIEEPTAVYNTPLTRANRKYSRLLSNSRRSVPMSKIRYGNVGLSPIEAKIFANVHASTNSYDEMANAVRKMPISTRSKNILLGHIEYIKQEDLNE